MFEVYILIYLSADKIANGEDLDDKSETVATKENSFSSGKEEFSTADKLDHIAELLESGKRKRKRKKNKNRTMKDSGEATSSGKRNLDSKSDAILVSSESPKKMKRKLVDDEDRLEDSPKKKVKNSSDELENPVKLVGYSKKKSPVKIVVEKNVTNGDISFIKSPKKKLKIGNKTDEIINNGHELKSVKHLDSPKKKSLKIENNIKVKIIENGDSDNFESFSLIHGKDSLELKREAENDVSLDNIQ